MKKIRFPYPELNNPDLLPDEFLLLDHLNGFTKEYENSLFELLQTYTSEHNKKFLVYQVSVIPDALKKRYNLLNLKFSFDFQNTIVWEPLKTYNCHPELSFKNFLCSFNGSAHVSRKLLVSSINCFGWFDPKYSSKNFSYSIDTLDGHITDYVANKDIFYRKFFIGQNSEEFFQTNYSFGHVQYDHKQNIYNLESKLTQSFLHIVSESLATSYVPFVTEKFLYSIVTRGLFLAYAQPGWHNHLEKYYGFKRYTKLFDYKFDTIQNPVKRLVELMSMISKFSVLSTDDWRDLYLLEQDTVEYNYNHYFSGNYLTKAKQYE